MSIYKWPYEYIWVYIMNIIYIFLSLPLVWWQIIAFKMWNVKLKWLNKPWRAGYYCTYTDVTDIQKWHNWYLLWCHRYTALTLPSLYQMSQIYNTDTAIPLSDVTDIQHRHFHPSIRCHRYTTQTLLSLFEMSQI